MVVLDSFLGTGSTALAAIDLNRKYLGIEIDKRYAKIAKERIDSLQKQQKLFN